MNTGYVFDKHGNCLERNTNTPLPSYSAFQKNYGDDIMVYYQEIDLLPSDVPIDKIKATIQSGQVIAILVDPTWTPPEPPADPLEELHQALSKNNLTSVHDKKWADQKEYLKEWGIPWIKAHPACTQAEAVAALEAELASEFPGQARVVSIAGVLQSYADEAVARGMIPAATFEALRDLVASTTNKQLRQMLRTM